MRPGQHPKNERCGRLRRPRLPSVGPSSRGDERQRHQGRWILSDADSLFVMLIHPAFSKHLSPSQMGLHRVADILLWVQRRKVDWGVLRTELDACGLKTAAWTILSLVRMLSPAASAPLVAGAIDSLRPGPLRSAYLNAWLRQDLSARLTHVHAARLAGVLTTAAGAAPAETMGAASAVSFARAAISPALSARRWRRSSSTLPSK